MKRSIRNLKNEKDKISGNLKTAAGKLTGNEQLELKGRIQTAKGTINEKTDVGNVIHNTKENIAAKINNMTDKK